jgi:hypothetical protein
MVTLPQAPAYPAAEQHARDTEQQNGITRVYVCISVLVNRSKKTRPGGAGMQHQ